MSNNSRTRNSLSNIKMSLINNILTGIFRFILRAIFIRCLGETMLGVNGLFTNILSILSLTELGVGTAINFSLYKPLAEKNTVLITQYMNFYKKAYRYIALIILGLGMACLPFLKYIINEYENVKAVVPELNWIYILFLLNTVITYLMSYKRTLIIADQREYKMTPIIMLFNIFSLVI